MDDLKSLPPPEKYKTLRDTKERDETLVALLSSKTKTEAAQKLSLSRNALYERIEKWELDKVLARIPQQALQTLQMGSDLAAETLIDALGNRHERLDAAKEILDRVGLTGDKATNMTQINIGSELGVKFEKG